MTTRKHIHQIELAVSPEEVFRVLVTPSAIRDWWGASRVIVLAKQNGVWAAVWGNEDIPDYVALYKISAIEPPRRLFLTESKYFAKSGQPPFDATMTTEFIVEASAAGAVLRVTQDGFPADAVADEFYAACETGWKNTFASIEKYLACQKA
ncbi:MAG: SRPBCC domain-containing protein [Acidobacteria bacterium]|nr:SRPBCC domain-containing protein [Acidobacteriota bacterium]